MSVLLEKKGISMYAWTSVMSSG